MELFMTYDQNKNSEKEFAFLIKWLCIIKYYFYTKEKLISVSIYADENA